MHIKALMSACTAFAALVLTQSAVKADLRCANGKTIDVRLYVRNDCARCTEAEYFLYREGISFLPPIDADDPAVQEHLNHGPGYRTMPVFYLCGEWIVGFGEKQKAQIFGLFIQPARYVPQHPNGRLR